MKVDLNIVRLPELERVQVASHPAPEQWRLFITDVGEVFIDLHAVEAAIFEEMTVDPKEMRTAEVTVKAKIDEIGNPVFYLVQESHRSDWALEMHCTPVDVTPTKEPDPDWHHVDAAGHEHKWTEREPDAWFLNTLKWIIDGYMLLPSTLGLSAPERVSYGHCECKDCGEEVVPRYRAPLWRKYAPGKKWGEGNFLTDMPLARGERIELSEHLTPQRGKSSYHGKAIVSECTPERGRWRVEFVTDGEITVK